MQWWKHWLWCWYSVHRNISIHFCSAIIWPAFHRKRRDSHSVEIEKSFVIGVFPIFSVSVCVREVFLVVLSLQVTADLLNGVLLYIFRICWWFCVDSVNWIAPYSKCRCSNDGACTVVLADMHFKMQKWRIAENNLHVENVLFVQYKRCARILKLSTIQKEPWVHCTYYS